MLWLLEYLAAHYGCQADTLQGWFAALKYQRYALHAAEFLSDCARAFFGV